MSRKDSLFGNRPGHRKDEISSITVKDRDIEKIQGLHESIGANLNNALQNAILIGEILNRKKKELSHGQFLPWIESNLPFTRMTANKYMRLFENKEKLPNVNSGLHLTEALKILSGSEKDEKEINPKRKPEEMYKIYREGGSLNKEERVFLKTWISEKVGKLRQKADQLEKDIKKIK
ncbi:DUF3102 domain-containing protein [Leptospira bourretii]|uniref:DUF3102 domain-containing protein n=1 Tax=Leptospira bourretii TaxID=2484962 RepID=A0A4R9IGW5_9LEPT|nr:DUF3102 domain-containing protein [Leptospira bourretii]TGK87209.1 DUF3102 domain-containing protein [Leptospira bourretii]TGK87657.1 DUF3102 domain-containing protein [Leptospira bourretii]TGL43929.1 DUF3102 domain-containing protein [Leptospira bourretii]